MTEISEKEIEAAQAVLERRIYDEGGCEAEQVPAMVREMLEAAARVRAENAAFQDAVVTGLGAVKMDADGTTERVDLRAGQNAWRPIETAPKDGDTPVLLWGRYWSDSQGYFPRPLQGYWSERNQRWEATGQPYHGFAFGVRPTHWMPLPTPLTAGGDDE